jgi:7-carboxy-7-deazaguanine synthase
VSRIFAAKVDYVCITGGEPLLYAKEVLALSQRLMAFNNIKISIETNGEIHIPTEFFWHSHRLTVTMDVKTPGSGNKGREGWKENIKRLRELDTVKFVIAKITDMSFVKECLGEIVFGTNNIFISPIFGKTALVKQAAAMFINDPAFRLCTFQTQLHKVIWGAKKRNV